MNDHLLDLNVLVALFWPSHIHDAAFAERMVEYRLAAHRRGIPATFDAGIHSLLAATAPREASKMIELIAG